MNRKKNKRNKETEGPNHHGIPTSIKKFRQTPEIEGFYRFIYENDLRVETFEIIDRISEKRKTSKRAKKNNKP